MLNDILPQLSELLLVQAPISYSRVSGGDINDAFKISTDKGDSFFLKVNTSNCYDILESEKEGLEKLRSTGIFQIPEVIGLGKGSKSGFLLLEWLDEQRPTELQWQNFGENLSRLHGCTQSDFGGTTNNYIGSIPQQNDLRDSWHSFFMECRIEPLIKKAYDTGILKRKHVVAFNALCAEAPSLFPSTNPSLLHGDLWSGNFMWTGGASMTLFDPSVYYGHPEMELAFTTLFGGFAPAFYEAYQASNPLEPGFQKRIGLYNLYPNLVHLLLFGQSYQDAVDSVLLKFDR